MMAPAARAAWQAEQGMATVAEVPGHLDVVTGITAKIEAAAAHGARLLFLPKANEPEARRIKSQNAEGFAAIDVRFLESAAAEPRAALQKVLSELESPPMKRDGWEFGTRAHYHLRMPAERAEHYYIDELVDDVVARLKKSLPADHAVSQINRLVLVASDSRGGAYLLTKLFDPREVLILHDGGLKGGDEPVASLATGLEQAGRSDGRSLRARVAKCLPGAGFETAVRQAVAEWAAEDAAARVFIDVTLGHRDFLFAVLAAAPKNAVVGYLTTEKRNKRFEAGTEQLKIVDWWPVTGLAT